MNAHAAVPQSTSRALKHTSKSPHPKQKISNPLHMQLRGRTAHGVPMGYWPVKAIAQIAKLGCQAAMFLILQIEGVDLSAVAVGQSNDRQARETSVNTQEQAGSVISKANTSTGLARTLDLGLVVVGSYDLEKVCIVTGNEHVIA
eukprot:scaffold21667_cov20-Tisochrysis_lutea.AAC.6